MLCAAHRPSQTHRGARTLKAKGCRGWEPLSGVCLSVSRIIGTQRLDCVSCIRIRRHLGVFL